mgnify:CR=1 FL=1
MRAEGRTLFALGEPGNVEVFREWAPFVARLDEKLNGEVCGDGGEEALRGDSP